MDIDAVTKILDDIYDEDLAIGALIVKPATDEELERLQRDLAEAGEGIPLAPPDLLDFLRVANGVAWNGFEFFGTYQVTVKQTGYTLPDIVTMNIEKHGMTSGLEDMLYIGRIDEDTYVYNAGTGKYVVLDALTRFEVETYDSYEELFLSCVTPYVEACLYPDADDEGPSLDEGE